MGTCNSQNERRKKRHTKDSSAENTTKMDSGINPNINEINQYNIEELNQNKNINNELKNSQNNDSKNQIGYFLICPDCSERSPHIEKIYYDEKSKNFSITYTCICHESIREQREAPLYNILSNKEPKNLCNIHPGNKLINFCQTCQRAICNICKEENHNSHELEENICNISKEEANNMLELVKQKQDQFNNEIYQDQQKIEKGIDNMIQKLNFEKQNYKEQLEKYKDNNQKTFEFLKNLYGRYINNVNEINDNLINKKENNINNDVMLPNYMNKFTIIDSNIPKINSNVDEILNQYNDDQKELQLKYDYGFTLNNRNSLQLSKIGVSQNINFNDKKEFSCIKTFTGHKEKIVSLIELSSGELATGSYDYTIRIWNMENKKEDKIINESGKVFSLLEFENGKLLSGTSENNINLWEINSSTSNNNCLFSFTGHELWINCLVKCSKKCFASASNDSKIKIWDYYNRKYLFDLEGHEDCILSLILLKNNNLCSGSADLTIRIWDWENKICLTILKGHEKWVKCIYELDNGVILSGSDDKTIKLWKDNNLILTLHEHTYSVRTFCQINKKYFASGSFDCTIKIWEIDTYKCIQTLTGHQLNIICIITLYKYNLDENKSNKDKSFIASCANDKTIKIWEGIL